MNSFDTVNHTDNISFYKNNPAILKQLFGNNKLKSLWLADMDFKVPEAVSDEIKRLADRAIFAYEFNNNDVFKALADWYRERHNLHLNSDMFIQISGVLTALSVIIQEFTNPGDGILIQTPVYHQFASIIKKTDRRLINNPLTLNDNEYRFDTEDLKNKLSNENVKMIILCNPHNPVGRVWTKEELTKLSEIAEEFNVMIVSDKIHSDIIYRNNKFNSILSLENRNHIALLGSPAKTFGMHSISNGYIYTHNESIFSRIQSKVESLFLHHGNVISNYATIAAYTKGKEWLDELTMYLEKNIEWINTFIKREIPQIKLIKPQGTYQLWLDFRELDLNKNQLNNILFNQAQLAMAPGHWFGKNGAGFMRMNIASPLDYLESSMNDLKQVMKRGLQY
ncbi:MAG: PatB family C-S lyase [Bacteroidales bacterium]|jgi:cystathionine beta-lyase|nr:PatB family C-S lyase [Bacteroidales bacterium]